MAANMAGVYELAPRTGYNRLILGCAETVDVQALAASTWDDKPIEPGTTITTVNTAGTLTKKVYQVIIPNAAAEIATINA